MNVRRMVENAEAFIHAGRYEDGQKLLEMAYDYIKRMNPSGRDDLEAICCYISIIKNGKVVLIHCGKDDDHPLFSGTPDERKELCFACQKWCFDKIEQLKEK